MRHSNNIDGLMVNVLASSVVERWVRDTVKKLMMNKFCFLLFIDCNKENYIRITL